MRIKTIYLFSLSFLLISGLACTKDFEAINTNPNTPEQVAPQFLLSNILWEAADGNTRQGWLAGNMLAQHTSNIEFQPIDRYDMGNNTDYWNTLYRLLNDINSMNNAPGSNEGYEALGQIMKAWIGSQLTDLWTHAPWTEAIQGQSMGNFTPGYDIQQNIYTASGGILELLEQAANTLANTSSTVQGDIMYQGDFDQWIRLANSLRVRYLLRISNNQNVNNALQSLVDSGQLMLNNNQNAVVPYLSSSPNQWFIFNERVGRYTDLRMSTTIDSVLKVYNDPRNEVWFKPTNNSQGTANPVYFGIPNGLSRDSQNAYDLSDVSLLGAIFRDEPNGIDAQIMLYAELQFALAEAVSRGLISGSAQTYYENGINATFDYYNTTMPADYLSQVEVALDGTNDLTKILTQKWLSLINNGHEAWFNIRRTDLPKLEVSADNLNANVYPKRYRYPESEQAANLGNYNMAIGQLSQSDTYNSPGWWGLP